MSSHTFAHNLFWCSGQIFCTGMMKPWEFHLGCINQVFEPWCCFHTGINMPISFSFPFLSHYLFVFLSFLFLFQFFFLFEKEGFRVCLGWVLKFACKIWWYHIFFFILVFICNLMRSQDHFPMQFIYLLCFSLMADLVVSQECLSFVIFSVMNLNSWICTLILGVILGENHILDKPFSCILGENHILENSLWRLYNSVVQWNIFIRLSFGNNDDGRSCWGKVI